MVADDLDGVLVRADGTVAAQTPELALLGAGSCGDGSGLDLRQRQAGDIIGDAEGEALLRLILLQLLEQSEDGGRGSVLAAQTVTAAGQDDIILASLTQGSCDIQVQGSPREPGSLVRSRTATFLAVAGRTFSRAEDTQGRYRRTLMIPTFSPLAFR